MKHVTLILCMALAMMTTFLASCASDATQRREQLTQLANTVITAGELSGKINPKQAALIRKGGVLLLEVIDGKQPELAALSEVAVQAAIETKAITPEEAALLHSAGTIPLNAQPGSTEPIHPASTTP